MWLAVRTFFSNNAAALLAKLAVAASLLGAVAAVYRAGTRAQENKNMREELGHAKEALRQDGIVAGNSDVDGMRDRLSEALRHKRDS